MQCITLNFSVSIILIRIRNLTSFLSQCEITYINIYIFKISIKNINKIQIKEYECWVGMYLPYILVRQYYKVIRESIMDYK